MRELWEIDLDVCHLNHLGRTIDAVVRAIAIAEVQISARVRAPSGVSHGRNCHGKGNLFLHDLVSAPLNDIPAERLNIGVPDEELGSLPVDEANARLAVGARLWLAMR